MNEIDDETSEAAATMKSMMLALLGRLAILMEAATEEQARRMIEEEVEQALGPLFELHRRYREEPIVTVGR